ncbi:hypothetical protein AVHY2522_20980 [Acidovorax sp. SUPP2522]|uniref:hypothetical protein n=1 Tax=unclassified Acidovorax TaxID=2684926 RepID=UPI00234A3B16|nr:MULTISPECIES: hypothetical protein [unclassified Acidovorax]WCM96652.1 hypothetical protein M5C96_19825 [Acidovorax sp. GBBC 1281]GKT19023.1 hypothetical protein AVHY2522_20980 [Acidovorax sp. SUPP2522]
MAFQVGTACYPTSKQAAEASASAQVGAVVSHGGTAYVMDIGGVADASITYRLQPVAGGTPIQIVSTYTAQPCGFLQLQDGLVMGWMVAAAWIATYSVMFLARALRGEETNDNA